MVDSAELPTARALLDAASLERVAFERVGRLELARRTWNAAREAAEQARRDCWKRLAAQYGARNPHWGWASFVLLVAGVCAAIAAVLSLGFRVDPAQTAVPAAVLSAIAALGLLVVSLASRGRPQGRGFFRVYLVGAIGLGGAAAFQLSRGLSPLVWVVVVSALIGIGAFAAYLIVRGANPTGTAEIDGAISVALARMQGEVDALAERMQSDLLAQLSVQEQHDIVQQRTTLISSRHIAPEDLPAGGVIIRVLLATWVPETMREDVAKAK